jgi:sugar O-acyltransferase (sialic acid O-acetyltransferase NeuD family)
MAQFVIIGAGGLAMEVAALVASEGHSVYGLLGLPDEVGDNRGGLPVIGTETDAGDFAGFNLLIAVGYPKVKRQILTAIKSHPPTWPAFISARAHIVDRSSFCLGQGSIIAPGVMATCHISIGQFSYINMNATIGHGVTIGECCQVNPGANLSGGVAIGDGVLVGTGAQILEGLTIGDGAVIGAGAVVTREVEPRTTVFSVPTRRLP